MTHELSTAGAQAVVALSRAQHDHELPPGPYRVAIVGLETSRIYVCRWLDETYGDIGAAREAAEYVRRMATAYNVSSEGVRVIVADTPTVMGIVSF